MSHYNTRWCSLHGEWDDDTDNPSEGCEKCIEQGIFKTRAMLEARIAELEAQRPSTLTPSADVDKVRQLVSTFGHYRSIGDDPSAGGVFADIGIALDKIQAATSAPSHVAPQVATKDGVWVSRYFLRMIRTALSKVVGIEALKISCEIDELLAIPEPPPEQPSARAPFKLPLTVEHIAYEGDWFHDADGNMIDADDIAKFINGTLDGGGSHG